MEIENRVGKVEHDLVTLEKTVCSRVDRLITGIQTWKDRQQPDVQNGLLVDQVERLKSHLDVMLQIRIDQASDETYTSIQSLNQQLKEHKVKVDNAVEISSKVERTITQLQSLSKDIARATRASIDRLRTELTERIDSNQSDFKKEMYRYIDNRLDQSKNHAMRFTEVEDNYVYETSSLLIDKAKQEQQTQLNFIKQSIDYKLASFENRIAELTTQMHTTHTKSEQYQSDVETLKTKTPKAQSSEIELIKQSLKLVTDAQNALRDSFEQRYRLESS